MTGYFHIPDLRSIVSLRQQALEAASDLARQCPSEFRKVLCVESASTQFAGQVLDWQQADLAALDPAWRRLAAGERAAVPALRRAYIERPRGHSKTTDTAVQLAWVLFASDRAINGLVAAADLEQARLVHAAMQRIADGNPELLGELRFVENAVRNRANGSLLKIVSSDVRSSYGELPDFVVCDELCHWKSPDLWYSLLSSAAKRPESILVVLSNAGIGRGWQWDAREAARADPAWYFSTLDGPQAPWITEDSLAEQRRLLPPAVFARLWLNQWQHSDGEFVSLAEVEACRDESRLPQPQGEPGIEYVASIDYAEKRDLTVGCVCHREGSTVIVDRMDVVRPSPSHATPVKWVSDWMHAMATAFPGLHFIVDSHQLVSVIQSLEAQYPIQRFEFRAGQGNCELALTLRQLILERQVRWPPGCGVIPGEAHASPRDDLEHELASLVVRELPGGRFRFDHRNDGRHHDDRSFALAVACHTLVGRPQCDAVIWNVVSPERGGLIW
jgi:hypothetical protein